MIRDGDIASSRLWLRPLDEAVLDLLIAGDIAEAGHSLGASVPHDWAAAHRELFAVRRDDLADAAYRPWGLRALIQHESGVVVGHAGFHAAPARPDQTVEIGYAIEPAHRGQGLATEALNALTAFGWSKGATRIALSIRPANAPSIAMARRAGFIYHSERHDEIDGLEQVWLKATP